MYMYMYTYTYTYMHNTYAYVYAHAYIYICICMYIYSKLAHACAHETAVLHPWLERLVWAVQEVFPYIVNSHTHPST